MPLATNTVYLEKVETFRMFIERKGQSLIIQKETQFYLEYNHGQNFTKYESKNQTLNCSIKNSECTQRLILELKIETILKELSNWKLVSLTSIVENLKAIYFSIINVWNNQIDIQEAIKLSRIEEDFQISLNGKIEGHHDYDENIIYVNLKATILFPQLIQIESITY